jgi:hypothetical protein
MPPQTPPDRFYADQDRSNGTYIDQAQTQWVDRQRPAPEPPEPPRPPASRRSILRGIATVGAVGAAAAIGAGAVVEFDRQPGQPTLKPVSKPVAMAPMAPTAMAGPLVVYIADTTTGVLDVFGGTGETQVHNPALVSQLLANLKLA